MSFMRGYISWIDGMNRLIGRITMFFLFVLMGILLWSSMSKVFFLPSLWTLEMAQFVMVAYYILGGPYSIQLGSNVRMDLIYSELTDRRKAWMDAFTVFFLIFYLGVMIYGGLASLAYSLGNFMGSPLSFFGKLIAAFVTGGPAAAADVMGYIETSRSSWGPVMWPIKLITCIGLFMMLLQVLSEFFKDLLRLRGEEI
ncbi:TRAP-type mannitol/chloroaromatic compound transport system, small permease component [Pseudooceanicola antarcticus]|uniref:TRAP transporter small permease protein n=1 Tax=Pseudooceanicola antarcticus TaxID=1247613 RepID=A0A285IIU1_9RHOB|nr:TRAP transporter small permease subunit [Pseudooceanicola antarcticus]PJE28877.1 C4-dicarboxylate ABC transporter [Pseudooceanicola antarcticus]SNY47888.1 TRAP-type mannitol/chloroaromatic compound transport system, small permease component [Pseudooceanicola antarcticus]